jgi:hypothetical protein
MQTIMRNNAPPEAAEEEAGNDNAQTIFAAAPTSANPRSLHVVLWEECERGIGGRRAARLFTSREERGRVKNKHHRRKMVWDLTFVRGGPTAQAAIDWI